MIPTETHCSECGRRLRLPSGGIWADWLNHNPACPRYGQPPDARTTPSVLADEQSPG